MEAKSTLIRQLILVSDAYCAGAGQSRSAVAKVIFGRGGHIDDLEGGKRDLATGTFEKAMSWFSANWPASSTWPDSIARPMVEAA